MMRVAVVIPCRNEEKYIEKCVRSVLNSSLEKCELRVVVCDGKSTDGTIEIINRLQQEDSRVVLLSNEKQTTPFALNLGIRKNADCDVHIILGAHAEIAPDYVQRCIDGLLRDESLGCIGGVINNVNEDRTSEIIAKAMSSPFGVGNAHFRTGGKSGYVDTVAFGAYPAKVFQKAGYFDEDLTRNQDDEFNYRVIKSGFRIFLDPLIRSSYYVRASYSKLARQYYQYGFWKVYVNKKHNAVTSMRQLVPPAFVLFLMTLPLTFLIHKYLWVWLIVSGIYLTGALFATIAQHAKLSEIPGVVFSFLILHSAYGFGYLRGVVRFIIAGGSPDEHHSISSR